MLVFLLPWWVGLLLGLAFPFILAFGLPLLLFMAVLIRVFTWIVGGITYLFSRD
jgi:hypothetical protein